MRSAKMTAAAIVPLALSAGILASCSGNAESPLPGGGGAGGDCAGRTMVVPVNRSPWLSAYQQVVSQYQDETGVQVDLREYPNAELRTQYVNDIQQGTHTFDLFQISEGNTAEFYANEWVQPLNEIDPDFSLDPEVLSYDNFSYWDAENKVSSADGDLVAVPLNGNISLYMYRADVLDELGADVPQTWDQVFETGDEAAEAGLVDYGYVMRTQGVPTGSAITYDFMPIFYSTGGNWFVDQGADWTPAVDTDEGVEAAQILRRLASMGPAETTTIGQAEATAIMQAGQAAQTHLAAAAAAQLESESDSNVAGLMGYAPMPAAQGHDPAPTSGVFALAVPAGLDQERAQCAVDFLDWIQQEDVQVAFGEAGGIPVRSDALQADSYDEETQAYFSAIEAEGEYVRPHLRYEFGTQMLTVTEPILTEIAAGTLSPEDGMAQMQEELTEVVTAAGYPMAGHE